MNNDNITLQQWFAEVAAALGLHKDINHPSNRDYDYINAYYKGVSIPKPGEELPSEFKGDLNSTRYINLDGEGDYYDTKTNQVVGVQDKMIQDVRRQERRENFLDQE
tara:strand:- start:1199 stop:1519 length:321 start_codon:yes stop_codon:yes gene_type:complete